MRTKVERKQRVLEEKLKLNMPSPKVVLDASDCARLLDGAGKTSVVVVEKEGKMVAASSLAASSDQNNGPTVTVATEPLPTLKSQAASEQSSLHQIKATASVPAHQSKAPGEQSAVCDSVSVSSSMNEHKEKWTKVDTSSASNNKDDTVSSLDQSKPILKPPKKRRGVEFEIEVSSQSLLNNSVVNVAPQFTPTNQLANENASSKSSPRHSVERILQQNPVHSSQTHNNLAQSTPVLSAGMEIATSSAQTSVPLSDSSSVMLSDESHPPPCYLSPSAQTHNQLHPHQLPSSALQSECVSHLQPLPKNNSCNTSVHDNALSTSASQSVLHTSTIPVSALNSTHSLQTVREDQEEPINLSTSSSSIPGKSVISPVTTQAGITVPIEGAMTPAEGPEPDLTGRGSPVTGHGSTNKQQSGSNLTCVDAATDSVVSEVCNGHFIEQNGLPTDALSPNNLSDYTNTSREGAQTQLSNLNAGTKTVHDILPDNCSHSNVPPDFDVSASSLTRENHDPPCSASSQIKDKDMVGEGSESSDLHSKADSCGSENTPAESSQHIANGVLVSKSKKLSKKKPEIPMDDASCAQRLNQYALIIDDVIANYVYVHEPVEEIRLTEEEELALRGQFDDTCDPSNSDKLFTSTQSSSCVQGSICNSNSLQSNSTLKVQSAETQTTIYLAKHPPKKRATETGQVSKVDEQSTSQTSSNIDSVLEAVASDVTKPVDEITAGVILPDRVKTNKKKKVVKKEVETAQERKTALPDKEGITPSELNQHGSVEVSHSSEPEPQQAISDKTDGSSSDKNLQAKSLKPKKARKRKSDDLSSNPNPSLSQPGSISAEKLSSGSPLKRKKKVVKKPKPLQSGEKSPVKDSACLPDNSSELTSLLDVGKDLLGANKTTETSDIGESIASTSGGSEQDTPVHESEVMSGKQSCVEDKDKDNQDTGLESSGGEDSLNKPLRHYKKRLDFVKCDHCEHQARGRSALSRHMKKVHQLEVDMPHKCPQCSYGCSKPASLNRHLFTHGVFSCSRCSFIAETRVALAQHVGENHRDKLDLKLCKICNRYIKCDQLTIEDHTSKCQGPTPFRCTVCEKDFKYASSLRVHYHTHFPDQPKKYKCELCDYRTNYKANLHKHHKNMHAEKEKEIQCPDCGKLFSTEDNMRRHRKVHTLARPFACETCKKTFKTAGALKGHTLVHTATRTHVCSFTGCNRSFRTAKFLKSHQEEFHRLVPKKYFCPVEGCSYSFFKRSHLKRHAITHTGERNFHCAWPGCSKSFRHSDNLKVHFRAHSTDIVLQCHLCDFKTKQKSSMFWHKKKVHQVVESSKSGLTSKSERSEGAPKQEIPQVAESGCQTALALSDDHSEDGSIMGSLTHDKAQDSVAKPVSKGKQPEGHGSPKAVTKTKVQGIKVEPDAAESRGSRDLYEFKSDDDSEEEAPGSFRRDLIPKDELPPLPPPPKELLMKNELEEQREQARLEKEEKKELEKLEKLQKREQEKKERAEKRDLEKKEKLEKKEQEKKEKIEKKEQEKKEKIEKKEVEKKEKEEQKELEKKERIEKKEMEKKEKIEQRELEKKEKAEKKEQERKEKLEKKELEIKEKTEKREKEKQEKEQARIEKEKAKKEREEQRKAKEQFKLEKDKENEQKKAEKEKQELENSEEKESTGKAADEQDVKKKSKPGKKPQKKAKDSTSKEQMSSKTPKKNDETDIKKESVQTEARGARKKLPAKGAGKKSQLLARKKSPRRMSLKEEEEENTTKPKRGRKKKVPDVPEVTKVVATRKKKMTTETEEQQDATPPKKKRMSKKSEEDTAGIAVSPRSPRSPRGVSPRASSRQPPVAGRKPKAGRPKAIVGRGKKRKSLPVTRKMSARIKAKSEITDPVSPVKTAKIVKGRRGAKPGPKKKVVEKKEPEPETVPELEQQEVKEDEKNSTPSTREEEDVKTEVAPKKKAGKQKDPKTNGKKEEGATLTKVEVKKISTRGRAAAAAAKESEKDSKEEIAVDSLAVADRPESPAYSEELMLQGNASPYRGLSDADEEEEDKEKSREEEKTIASSPAPYDQNVDELRTNGQEEVAKEEEEVSTSGNLKSSEQPKKEDEPDFSQNEDEPDVSQNEDAYSSDDDVSNDIPLTPPRAPAPPPRESSDDEMEEAVEPESSAPFSVPGPNTPFSVPGPNTPFSVPGPNTPFSVPGPHTPFSVPPPTNLMQQQHSVPSEDTPLSTAPSVQSTEMHSHSSVELQHSLGSVEMQHSHNSVEMSQQQSSVEMAQPHSQGSIEMQHHSRSSTEMHHHNSSGEINHSSVDMHMNNNSGELHSQVPGEVHQRESAEGHHSQGTVQLQSDNGSVDMHAHRPVEMFSHESVEIRQESSYDAHSEASHLQKLREEAMNSVKCSEGGEPMSMADKYQFSHHSGEPLGKYSFPHPLPDHSHAEADKAYFDQYLKNLSSARGGLGPSLTSSPSGLQQLEAMVGKSHIDGGGPKSPVSAVPSSVITSLENNLAADSRTLRGDALPHHHEALYAERETPSSLPRLPDRQSTNTPLPPSGAPTPAFEAFSHLNPLHAAPPSTAVPGRDNAYLRQADNLFPTPPVSSSFMAEAMFQRQAMSTPFLPPPPPQTGERNSVLTSHNSSSTLLGRAGTMPTSDMFSASQAMQPTMTRNPFTNAWTSQDSRASHWQTPYLPRQSNMATPGTFFPGKESYLTGREFMFDPTSVRASAEGRSMFPSLSGSSQGQDSLPLDRFDLSNYFPNAAAMAPYGSSAAATSLDYTRSGHASSTKPFDERYRQTSMGAGATSGAIPNFRSLPAVSGSGSDMFHGIPGVNPHFNLYAAAGNPMSYHHHHHSQHPHHHQLTDGSVNSAFLSHHHPHHPGSAQHAAMFERDYRGLYPQNAAAAAAAAYPFINDRQYPGAASKLGHTHPSVGPSASASSRTTTQEGQMQDPYRTMLYRY